MDHYPHWKKTPKSEGDWFEALIDLARYLRTPSGCPWDREQHSKDFAGYLGDEARELLEAYGEENPDNAAIQEEAGDCLFTLLASIAAAEEEGRYSPLDALKSIHDKMIRRHGHVFGDEKALTADDALDAWERVKAEEKKKKR